MKASASLACCAALLAASAAATAQENAASTGAGIIGADNREAVESAESPWSAIGQINVAGLRTNRKCTGTRIAPGLVLADAACVYDVIRKKPFPPQNIHFIAGADRGKYIGHATARCVRLPEAFDTSAKVTVNPDLGVIRLSQDFLRQDLALIILEADIPAAGTIPLAARELSVGKHVVHAAYAREKRQRLMADMTCQVTNNLGGTLATNCDSGYGGGGGPILAEEDGELKIAAVMVAMDDESGSVVTPVANWHNLPLDASCP